MSWLVASVMATGVLALACPWFLTAAKRPALSPPSSPAPTTATAAMATPLPAASGTVTRGEEPLAAEPTGCRELQLPDGTSVPTLNDAVDAAPLAVYWGSSPWSPIVGIERSDAGLDWYRHADGSYSTTQMVWRKDLGRSAAMTRVAHPGPVSAPAAPANR